MYNIKKNSPNFIIDRKLESYINMDGKWNIHTIYARGQTWTHPFLCCYLAEDPDFTIEKVQKVQLFLLYKLLTLSISESLHSPSNKYKFHKSTGFIKLLILSFWSSKYWKIWLYLNILQILFKVIVSKLLPRKFTHICLT